MTLTTYPIETTITMPIGARILGVFGPKLHVLVPQGGAEADRTFIVAREGQDVPDGVEWVGAYYSGLIWWHVFEVR